MNTILVTGGAGFIGSHLCERLLEAGHKVINIDNFNDFYDPEIKKANIAKAIRHSEYILIKGDILDEILLNALFQNNKIDTVIHLAALAGVRKSVETPQNYIDVDIKGTVNLLECCKTHKANKFIFASSSSVYGANCAPFTEDQNISCQLSPYAAAKASGELFCRTYNSLYGIPIVCLRFFTVYGPRQRPEMAIHNFTKQILDGKELVIYGDGKSCRDYTYIDDIIDGILAAMELQCDFEIINLGNSTPVKLNQVVELLASKLGKLALKRFAASQKGDVEITQASIDKAERLLGYQPKVGIKKGIDRFVNWFLSTKQT